MEDLRSLPLPELTIALQALQLPRFRVQQIFTWLQAKGVASPHQMTNLPLALRNALAQTHFISSCSELKRETVGDSTKFLFALHDGTHIESVAMRYRYGTSLCVSSQVGCRMGCAFCATGGAGFTRQLLPGEMLQQLQAAGRALGQVPTRVVLMGMGEPLDNYDNVLRFLQLVSAPQGLGISARRISLSTCGLVPQMHRLSQESLGLTLSVSLHAPNNALRSALMPINQAHPLQSLLAACDHYTSATHRRISYEYALFRGINDSQAHARELAALLKGKLAHINLIPGNPTTPKFEPSTGATVQQFCATLQQAGLQTTVRRTLGRAANAACGQLAGHSNRR